MEIRKILGYVPVVLLIMLAYLSFMVVRPFLVPLIGALILAYIFYPVYKFLKKRLKNETICALITTILILMIATVPVGFMLKSLIVEANATYISTKQFLDGNSFNETECIGVSSFSCNLLSTGKAMFPDMAVEDHLKETVRQVALYLTQFAGRALLFVPSAILDLFLMVFIIFFTLRDGHRFVAKLDTLIPMNQKDRTKIFSKVSDVIQGVIYGSIIVAVIQGVVGGLGFFAFGVSSPIIWGLVMGLLAFIPLIGPMVIWGPAALILIVMGFGAQDWVLITKGIGLMVYGFLIISSVENILKPMVIGDKVKTHPILIILGVLGGLHVFGIIGLVLGPLFLEMLITLLAIIQEHWAKGSPE